MKKTDRTKFVNYICKHTRKKTREKICANIARILANHDDMQGAYFWQSPSCAACRRSYERKHTETYNDKFFDLESLTECSAKNIYYKGTFVIYTENDKMYINAGDLKKINSDLIEKIK